MNTETNSTTTEAVAATAAPVAAISFTVKENDIVTGTVAKIKKHPDQGILIVIAGNPMSFLPNGCVAGKNNDEKAARRAELIANPGSEVQVSIMGQPTVELVKGKQVGRIKVSEQRAVIASEKNARAARASERNAAIEAAVASLEVGSIVVGTVKGVASKDSDRNPGEKHVFGLFVNVAPNVSGLLHVKEIVGGNRAIDSLVAAGTIEVEILSASFENGAARIQLSQKSVGQKAFFDQYPEGSKVKGKIVKTGEVVGDLHGRILELASGARVFLAEDDSNVKSESSLAKGNNTTVTITSEIIGGMVRVTRRG